MLQTQQNSIDKQLKELQNQMIDDNKEYSVSVVEQIEPIDPVDFFAKFESFQGQRMLWKSADDEYAYVGIGVQKAFQDKHEQGRFESIQSQWKEFLENTLISSDITQKGTGPTLLGGFSFLEKSISSDIWAAFPSSYMQLPKVMLTNYNGNSYLSYNVTLSQQSDIKNVSDQLAKWKRPIVHHSSSAESNRLLSKSSSPYQDWEALINDAVSQIKNGEMGKVVLARQLEADFEHKITTLEVLNRLYKQQKDSYIFAVENGEDTFIGASPEQLVNVEGQRLSSACLAGTTSRGNTIESDEQLASELFYDEKNRQEHHYVVEMMREAISPLCENVEIPDDPTIYPLRALQHLYTPVQAQLKQDYNVLDVVKHLHPTPALGGEPREKALEFIEKNEQLDRGWYAAPVGWMNHHWDGEFAVGIRSGLIRNHKAILFAGCGIVEDSDPEAEFNETELKLKPMLEALGGTS
ncbi:isochorismate synthase [Halalkalibacillus sediminis]|nr:isochorismate synthase [Halalkalibacillus sediminis]